MVPSCGTRYVIVGGGVCGVTCCQALDAALQGQRSPAGLMTGSSEAHVTLVAAAGLLKGVANVVRLSRHLDAFDVVEQPFDHVAGPFTTVLEGEATALDTAGKVLTLRDGRKVPYDKLCICTGARPKTVSEHARVLVLRDTASAQELRRKLQRCRRVLITGNGGIAMELVHEISDCEVVWVVRDGHIGNAFFDEDAAGFLAPSLASRLAPAPTSPPAPPDVPCALDSEEEAVTMSERAHAYAAVHAGDEHMAADHGRLGGAQESGKAATPQPLESRLAGSALGPQWLHAAVGAEFRSCHPRTKHALGVLNGAGNRGGAATAADAAVPSSCAAAHAATGGGAHAHGSTIYLETHSEVVKVADAAKGVAGAGGWPLMVTLSNGRVYGVDYVVSAVGVFHPDSMSSDLARSSTGAVLVDEHMRTSVADVYAAGDACEVVLEDLDTQQRQWFQMRLWSQARGQGAWAAHCMLGTHDMVASPLEIFAHATYFFGYKVVLLGRFNGQGLDKTGTHYQEMVRVKAGNEYIKVVLFNGRLQGAVLLGDTDLEETFENLILNQFDLTFLGDRLLDPGLDLEDYFD